MDKFKTLLEQIEKDCTDKEKLIMKWECVILDHAKELKDSNPKLYHELKDDFYISAYGEHFNKEMAEKAIEEMVYSVPDYKFNYTPEQIESYIAQSCQQATQIMSKYGKTANTIPEEINKWDKYYTYSMICSDYPLSHNGDNGKISMLAYEFLSDPDAPIGKAYRYCKAMDMN